MSEQTITLAGRSFPVAPIPFGKLKRLLPVINRTAEALVRGRFEDAVMDDMGTILCAATGLTPEELDALPIKVGELGAAFETVVDVTGLAPKEGPAPGEAQAVASPGTGTTSTPTSPPAPAGPGASSTP